MNIRIIAIASLLIALPVSAQKKKTVVNDSNTPLHLLQPAYQGTYGDLTPEQVKKEVDRVFAYIDKETPARVVDKNTGKVITDYATMGEEAILGNGAQYVDVKGNILMECYMQKTIYKDVVKIFDDASIPYMVFTTKGFYATEPQRVRDLFVQRCVNFFHQPYGEYDKGGKFENSTCNFLQAIGNVDDFLKQDFEIIKVEAFSLDASEIAPAKEKLQFVPMISYLSSFSDNVEVTDQNAQKGLILEKVAKLKNLSKDEIVVIGDGMNDLTMFQHFPYAFAPANADLEIQNLAYQIVADCEDDGFAEVIDIIFKDLM